MKIKPTPAQKPSMLQPKWIGLVLFLVGGGQLLNAAVFGLGAEVFHDSHILIGGVTAGLGSLMMLYDWFLGRERAHIDGLKRARSQKGFTLIEVIVTLLIVATLFTAIGGVLISVLKTQETVSESIDEEKIGYGVLNLLQRDFAGCVGYGLGPVVFRVEDKDNGNGEADEVHFITAATGEVFTADQQVDENGQPIQDQTGRPPPRYRKVSFVLRSSPNSENGDRFVLCRRAEALAGLDRDPTNMTAPYVEVVDGLTSFKIELKELPESEWQDGWPDPSRMPAAVRLTVDVAPNPAKVISAREIGASDPQPRRFQTVVSILSVSTLDELAATENQ